MAWISVHEQVLGGKLRILAKEIGCSQNEALGMLVRLWLWGINNAGREGRIEGATKQDVADILNVGIDDRYDPMAVVEAMIDTNWIDLDEGLYIHDWEEWQEQWYKALAIRKRDAERKRDERAKKREAARHKPKVEKPVVPKKEMEADLPTPKLIIPQEVEPKSQPVASYTTDFEEFWNEYPKKVGKGEAYKKYKARLNDGWSPGELLEAAKNYASKVIRERTDKQYIKHPKTFLSDSTPFTDFIPKMSETAVKKQGNDDDNPYADWS